MQSVEIPHRPVSSLAAVQSGSKKAKKMMELLITHPDQSVYSLSLPSNCTGQDCLDEVSLFIVYIFKFKIWILVSPQCTYANCQLALPMFPKRNPIYPF